MHDLKAIYHKVKQTLKKQAKEYFEMEVIETQKVEIAHRNNQFIKRLSK